MARILFLTSSLPDSPEDGVCGYVYDLARRLQVGFGHAVRVLAPEGGGSGSLPPLDVSRFRHPWIGARSLTASADMGAALCQSRLASVEAASFVATLAARAAWAAHDADLVCSHWLVPSGLVGALARSGRPHVAVAHGGDVHLLASTGAGRTIARTIAARSDRLVFVSDDLRERFIRLVPTARERSEVIPMGADIGPASQPSEVADLRRDLGAVDRPVVLFLGRLVPIKGVDVLLDAASQVPGLALWVAGDGPESERLGARARASGINASFLGRVDRARRRLLLDACDIVVVPSIREDSGRTEGMPVVFAEAMVAGRPVVASRVGGLENAIEDEQTGLLVPPGDPEALAAALRRIVEDVALRATLARRAREIAPRYSAETTATRFAALFDRLLDDSSLPGAPPHD